MTTAAKLFFMGAALMTGLLGYRVLRTQPPKVQVRADPVLTYVAENADTMRERIKQLKGYDQRMANERRLEMHELNAGIEREPENAGLRVKRALKYDVMGEHEAALSDIEVAIRVDTSRRYYLLFLRHLQLARLGRDEAALADVLAAIDLAPPEFSYHRNAAELHQRLGNAEAGVAVFDAGVRKDPGNLFLHADRARFIASLGRHEEALTEKTLAIDKETDPFQRQMRTYDRVSYLAAVGRFDEALEDANRLLRQDPRDTVALHARGDVYKAMGDNRRAKADYDSAMNINMDR
jgi:tetratricopeptide (TPR) repeat protein